MGKAKRAQETAAPEGWLDRVCDGWRIQAAVTDDGQLAIVVARTDAAEIERNDMTAPRDVGSVTIYRAAKEVGADKKSTASEIEEQNPPVIRANGKKEVSHG